MAEAGNFDTFARSRRMNEIVVADVKADVGNTAGTHGAEKDHVARLQFRTAHGNAHLRLFGRGARQVYTHGAFKDVLHEAAAVKAGRSRCAAVAVGHAEQAHGAADQFVCIA